MNNAAASDAVATPKLTDICCSVLAMVLAMLVSASATSENTSVFMLVNWSDEKNPKANAWVTITKTGVCSPTVAKRAVIRPMTSVLVRRTRR